MPRSVRAGVGWLLLAAGSAGAAWRGGICSALSAAPHTCMHCFMHTCAIDHHTTAFPLLLTFLCPCSPLGARELRPPSSGGYSAAGSPSSPLRRLRSPMVSASTYGGAGSGSRRTSGSARVGGSSGGGAGAAGAASPGSRCGLLTSNGGSGAEAGFGARGERPTSSPRRLQGSGSALQRVGSAREGADLPGPS